MSRPLFQVDAFADRLFTGNPAAVCPLTDWLPAETMQERDPSAPKVTP